MIKVEIKYSTQEEKQRMIDIISAGATIKKEYKTYKSGKYYRVYLDIE